MPAGNYVEVLLRVADQLCARLPFHGEPKEVPGARSTLARDETLSADDQSRALQMRSALAKIVAGLSGDPDTSDLPAVRAALDGAEMVMRGELLRNNEDELPRLLPSMVFLVAQPIVGQDRALDLSERTAALVQDEMRRIDLQ